jgi:hypothetical protein
MSDDGSGLIAFPGAGAVPGTGAGGEYRHVNALKTSSAVAELMSKFKDLRDLLSISYTCPDRSVLEVPKDGLVECLRAILGRLPGSRCKEQALDLLTRGFVVPEPVSEAALPGHLRFMSVLHALQFLKLWLAGQPDAWLFCMDHVCTDSAATISTASFIKRLGNKKGLMTEDEIAFWDTVSRPVMEFLVVRKFQTWPRLMDCLVLTDGFQLWHVLVSPTPRIVNQYDVAERCRSQERWSFLEVLRSQEILRRKEAAARAAAVYDVLHGLVGREHVAFLVWAPTFNFKRTCKVPIATVEAITSPEDVEKLAQYLLGCLTAEYPLAAGKLAAIATTPLRFGTMYIQDDARHFQALESLPVKIASVPPGHQLCVYYAS